MFVTCAIALLPGPTDDANKYFEYALAGHPAPAVFSPDSGSVRRLDLGSAALGLLPSPEFHSRRYEIHSGDLFLIFTDGLVEIMNSDGEEFGWDRLRAVVEKNRALSLRSISEAIFEEGARWGNVVDDRTLLLIRFV